MDIQTGEVEEYSIKELKYEQQERALHGIPALVKLKRKGVEGCKRCYGRGYTGKNVDTGLFQVCKCTLD